MAGSGGGYPNTTGTTVYVELDIITAESLLTALNNAIYGGGGGKKKKKGKGGKPKGGTPKGPKTGKKK
jgi:hypothetical protein